MNDICTRNVGRIGPSAENIASANRLSTDGQSVPAQGRITKSLESRFKMDNRITTWPIRPTKYDVRHHSRRCSLGPRQRFVQGLKKWTKLSSRTVDASSGELILSGTDWSAAVISGVPEVADLAHTSVRAHVAFEGDSRAGVGLLANGNLGNDTAYQGGIVAEGNQLYLGWNSPPFQKFARTDTDIDILSGEELFLQFDVYDNILLLWAWRVDEPMPIDPQLTFVDDTAFLPPGLPGVLFDPQGSEGAGIYRSIQISSSLSCDFDGDGGCGGGDIDALMYLVLLALPVFVLRVRRVNDKLRQRPRLAPRAGILLAESL